MLLPLPSLQPSAALWQVLGVALAAGFAFLEDKTRVVTHFHPSQGLSPILAPVRQAIRVRVL